MEILVDGRTILLPTRSLGTIIDDYLKELFTNFFNNINRSYQEFIRGCYEDFKQNLFLYLDSKKGYPPGQDYLFNNLTIIWNTYQLNGRVGEAQQFWNDILNIVMEWEELRKSRIHKGSIYYFWSQTAILQGELDKGFFLIHSAYEEDVLTYKTEYPGTPTVKTITLDYLDNRNLLFDLVTNWSNHLNILITNYRNITGSNFSMDDFRAKFLTRPPSRDALFSFTYNLARSYHFDLMPKDIVKGKFASLYELDFLFNVVLVTDTVIFSTLANPGPNDWAFSKLANHLLITSKISPDSKKNKDHLQYINQQQKLDFVKTINTLLDNILVYPDMAIPTIQERDLLITYSLRNYSAHNVNSFPVIHNRFNEIRQSVFNCLFFTIERIL